MGFARKGDDVRLAANEAVWKHLHGVLTPENQKKHKVVMREDLVTLDFETYYDDDFTLRKLSYTEYIKDERFEAIVCGIKIGTNATHVVEGPHIAKALAKINWKKHDLLCHNTPFDGFILSELYRVRPRKYFDTLSMARGLHGNDVRGGLHDVSLFYGGEGKTRKDALEDAKGLHLKDIKAKGADAFKYYKQYCADDVDETHRIFYEMLAIMPAPELDKIDVFVRAFCDPVLRVNRPRVEKELKREVAEKERQLLTAIGTEREQHKTIALRTRAWALEFARKEIAKNAAFAQMLRDHAVTPPMKPSPTHPEKMIYAFSKTDEAFLELKQHPNMQVRDLVDARLSVKSTTNETRAERFLKVSEGDAPLPVLLNYYAAHTGRPGGGNKMNMLNLVRKGELRRSILAPKGFKVVVADSGQIEARLAMWLADQKDMLEEFRAYDRKEGPDPYCNMATDVYGFPVDKDKNPTERFVGKVLKLGLQYQMGPPRLQATLALGALGGPPMFFELTECQKFVYTYRRKHAKIVQFWERCTEIIHDMVRGREGKWKCLRWEKERLWFPNGMCLKYPGLKETIGKNGVDFEYMRKGEYTKIYSGLLTENIVQGLANVIITEHMLRIADKYRIVTMTYDENVWIAPTAEAKASFDYGVKIMSTPPPWCPDLPLVAEGGYADNYSK